MTNHRIWPRIIHRGVGLKITDIKVHVLKPSGDIRNHAAWKSRKNNLNFVRVFTDEGIEGNMMTWLTGASPLALESSIENIKSKVLGRDPFDTEAIYYDLNFTGSFFQVNRFFNSAIDISCWDISGKAANRPIYKLLGGYRDRIRAYASTLAYDTIDEYVEIARQCKEKGFTALKLHVWGEPDRDIELCEAVRKAFPDMDLMMDALNAYDRAGALRVGRALDRLNFYWYESPLREEDIEGLRMLRRKLDTPIAATEHNMIGFLDYPEYITSGAVDIVRAFGDYIGGITPLKKTASLCEAFHIKHEPHSFGSALVQAAHLHLMLSIRNCDSFESNVPEGIFDAGMKEVIRVQKDGYVYAPAKPGLGLEIDWDYIDNETERVF
jgi:L-alanine-DL-glutamate epimerase-like enolase superfamily enzyme